MTDKQVIIDCKYKFQNNEKFEGKPYCTCFSELCEDLPPCDNNCQIYEDYKQLARKTRELEVICKAFDIKYAYDDDGKIYGRSNKLRSLEQECEELKKANQHIDTNRQCKGSKLKRIEELISDCETGYTDEFIQKIYGIIQEPEPTVNDYSITDRYRKALDEIEEATKYLKKDLCGHCGWYGTDGCTPSGMVCEELIKILDIINKAKGEGKCQ